MQILNHFYDLGSNYNTPTQDNSNITRKDFESFFSNVGPIKKCSLIRSTKAEVNANANNANANNANANNTNDIDNTNILT